MSLHAAVLFFVNYVQRHADDVVWLKNVFDDAVKGSLLRADMQQYITQTTQLEIRADGEMRPGVCGQVRGVALVYDTLDTYDTVFAPGCLTRTAAERVPAGKVKLFADHGPFTHTHVGVVRKIWDDSGKAMMEADLFDTEAGRAMKEYLSAVVASGASTGLSVGFRQKSGEWSRSDGKDEKIWRFTEIALSEISITPANSVPGTDVMSVRRESRAANQPRRFNGKFGVEDLGGSFAIPKPLKTVSSNSVTEPDVDPMTSALTTVLSATLLSTEESGAILPILGDAYSATDTVMAVYDAVAIQAGKEPGSAEFLRPTIAAMSLVNRLQEAAEDTTFLPMMEKLGIDFGTTTASDLLTHPIGPDAVYSAMRMCGKAFEPDERKVPPSDIGESENAVEEAGGRAKFVPLSARIDAIRRSFSSDFISQKEHDHV